MLALGDVVAKRFRLERQLGSGGMGAVFAATNLVTHKSVALKFLLKKNDDGADGEARRRVLREARAACAVSHPNVVSVHDVIENDDDGTPILVMDLLQGESLAARLTRDRTLSPADAMALVTPILSALGAAHAAGIVHRDLKPDNIFLVGGDIANVRILDFGVAKLSGATGATKETNRLTETGAMIGTPHYMAPEQAFGEPDIDARADLWSVGAVLYECLSGATPAAGQNLGQILKVLASGTIPPLLQRAPSVPPALAAVVDQLLRIEKNERPSSANQVLEMLQALGPQSPIQIEMLPSVASSPRPPTISSLSPATLVDPHAPQFVHQQSSPPPPRRSSNATRYAITAGSIVFGFAVFAVFMMLFVVRVGPAKPPPPDTASITTELPPSASNLATPSASASSLAPASSASSSATPLIAKKQSPSPAKAANANAAKKPTSTAAAPAASTGSSPLLNDPTF